MNRIYKYLTLIAAGAAMMSCVREIDAPEAGKRPEQPEGPAVVEGVFEVTRMALTNANVNWIDGSEALVWDGVQESPVKYVSESSNGLKTVLKGELSSKADLFYIAYPASGCKAFEEGIATFEIPAEQLAGPEGESLSLPATTFTALSKADAANNAAAIVLSIPSDDIKSLKVSTADGKRLTGTIDVDIYANEVSVKEEASSTVTVKPSAETFKAGTVTIATLPGTVAGGFKVEAEGADGHISTSWFRGEYTLEIARAVVLGEINRPLAEEVSFEARLEGQSSSTLTFSWSPSNYTDATADIAIPYSFALYKDAACQDVHVQFYTPASLSNWEKRHPKFIFTGLDPNTTYWFKAVREDYSAETLQTSNVLEAKTLDSKVVADATTANEGEVILSEDFSELLWFGDGVAQAMGYINMPAFKDATLTSNPGPALGEGNDQSRVTFISYGNESRLYSKMAAAVSGTRLAQWGQINEGSSNLVCLRPGYLKLGAESRIGTLVTPQLNSLPEGKYTDLEVTFRAARYESDPLNARVVAISGEMDGANTISAPVYGKSYRLNLNEQAGWNEYKVVVKSVQKGQRIAIGMDREANGSTAGSKQMRMFIDDITIKVVQVNDNPELTEPELSARARFTDATIKWNPVTGAEGYKISLNGAQVATQTETSYYMTDLDMNTDYTLKVEAYDRTQSAVSEVKFKTKNVWQVKLTESCRKASFEWDALEADYPPLDQNGNKRLYQMEVYTDAECANCVISCYSYNGYASTNTTFANSSWLGKSGGANLKYNTRITVGGLKPATNYWFRVRSLEHVKITHHSTGSDKEMSNPAGTSEWSKPIAFTTPVRHVENGDDVVAFCSFDDLCVHADYGNACPGITPGIGNRGVVAKAWNNGAEYWTGNYCTYELAITGHETKTWGFANDCSSYVNGVAKPIERKLYIGNQYSGDMDGWYVDQVARPAMGAILLDANNAFVATPALNSALLSEDGRDCVLTFRYMGISNSPENYNQHLTIRVYDSSSYRNVKTIDLAKPYLEGSAAKNSDFTQLFDWNYASIELNIKKGESVMILNQTGSGASRIVIDEFKIVTK